MGSLFVVFILAIFLIILISKGLIIVRQAETIIIERLGSYHRTLNNGLHIIWPIIDRPRQMIWRYIKTDVNGKNFIIQKVDKYDYFNQFCIYDNYLSIWLCVC